MYRLAELFEFLWISFFCGTVLLKKCRAVSNNIRVDGLEYFRKKQLRPFSFPFFCFFCLFFFVCFVSDITATCDMCEIDKRCMLGRLVDSTSSVAGDCPVGEEQ